MQAALGVDALRVNRQPGLEFPDGITRHFEFALFVRLSKQRRGVFRKPAHLPKLARRADGEHGHPERPVDERDFARDQFDGEGIGMGAKLGTVSSKRSNSRKYPSASLRSITP